MNRITLIFICVLLFQNILFSSINKIIENSKLYNLPDTITAHNFTIKKQKITYYIDTTKEILTFYFKHPTLTGYIVRLLDRDNIYAIYLKDRYYRILRPDKIDGIMYEITNDTSNYYWYVDGYYNASWLPKVYGYMMVLCNIEEKKDGIIVKLDAYMKVNSVFWGYSARLLNFLFPKLADKKIKFYTDIAIDIASATKKNPQLFEKYILTYNKSDTNLIQKYYKAIKK